jgi:hypothetical protein
MKMVAGDKSSALFWEDRWIDGKAIEIVPELLLIVLGTFGSAKLFS